ncbi:MAG: dephospho-CoA kinase [Burkholderiaceae bacterium]|jgi:dephospho-CoA kinase
MTINMLSVGLTGGIGSGKSLVADLFAAQGAAVIDTDQIAHQLTAAGGLAMPLIRQSFGNAFLTTEGALDRTRMRERVFTDAAARQQLEKILHPLIAQETETAAQRSEGAYLVFVVPLLVESGRWVDRVDRVLVVDCPEAMQIERVQARNQFSVAQVEAIMATQVQRSERLAVAHDVIVNDGPREAVAAAVERLHREYLALAAKKRAGGL